jgi:WD40 repeat protein
MWDGKVRAWDVGTGKEVDSRPEHAHAFLLTHQGKFAADACGNTVQVTDLRSGNTLPVFEGHRKTPLVRYALHSPDILLSCDGERTCLWERGNWKQETLVIPKLPFSGRYYFMQKSLDDGVCWEKGLYVRERDKRLELWDFKTGQLVRPLADVGKKTYSPLFSASGDRLVVHTWGFYHFIDVSTGKALWRLPRPNVIRMEYNDPEISPRGTYIALNEKGEKIELYEVKSGKLLRTLAPRPNPEKPCSVLRSHFATDEKILFGEVHQHLALEGDFSEEKISVTLWDVQSGEILQEMVIDPKAVSFLKLAMSEQRVGAFALSQDRRLVALARTGGKDVEIWETASGKRRGVLSGHDGPVVSLSFSADGMQLASGSEDTTVLVWDLHRPMQAVEPKRHLKGDEVAAHWQTLARPDAKEADLAIWSLVWASGDSFAFLKEHLRQVARPNAERLKRLLADLDSEEFKTRSAAAAEIEALQDQILDELQQAVRQKNTLEKQRQLESLLSAAQDATKPFGTAERLRQWRALEILEKAATPEAVALLKDLAGGVPSARLTQEARAVLVRLTSQTKKDR